MTTWRESHLLSPAHFWDYSFIRTLTINNAASLCMSALGTNFAKASPMTSSLDGRESVETPETRSTHQLNKDECNLYTMARAYLHNQSAEQRFVSLGRNENNDARIKSRSPELFCSWLIRFHPNLTKSHVPSKKFRIIYKLFNANFSAEHCLDFFYGVHQSGSTYSAILGANSAVLDVK